MKQLSKEEFEGLNMKEYKSTAEFIRQNGSVSETAIVTCRIVPVFNEDFEDNDFRINNSDYLKSDIVEFVNSKITNCRVYFEDFNLINASSATISIAMQMAVRDSIKKYAIGQNKFNLLIEFLNEKIDSLTNRVSQLEKQVSKHQSYVGLHTPIGPGSSIHKDSDFKIQPEDIKNVSIDELRAEMSKNSTIHFEFIPPSPNPPEDRVLTDGKIPEPPK